MEADVFALLLREFARAVAERRKRYPPESEFPPAQRGNFRELTPEKVVARTKNVTRYDFIAVNEYVYCEPFKAHAEWWHPVISVAVDFTQDRPNVQLITFLISGPDAWLGVRFDVPHVTVGTHDYFHAQFSRGIHAGDIKLRDAATLPFQWPAIPIDARTPVQMLICAFGSYLKRNTLRELVTTAGRGLDQLNNMHMTKWA
jgi:hypothetical protein